MLDRDSNHPDAALSEWVDDVADRFEADWRALTPPHIAPFLGEATGAERLALLEELVKLDIAYRRRLGEKRRVEDYVGEFAELLEMDSLRTQSLATTGPAPAVAVGSTPAPATAEGELPCLRGYEILRELGHGGMGVVYIARQVRLNRVVALKMILTGAVARFEARTRFRAEAEAAARLQHPHIVQIYEVGEQNGRPYFASEYVNGGNLAQRLSGTPQPAQFAAQLVQTLARAVEHAHQHGIVHRDLKPSNVLLARTEPPHGVRLGSSPDESGHFEPKIADFGLAKVLPADYGPRDSAFQTLTGEILGTPSYMAPEQAEGKIREIGPATDVYALGAILYELLTGRPPFKGQTTLDTLEQVRTQDPVPPSRLQPRLPRDLSTICLKALAKAPARRYASASELADDLRRFLDRKPIRARPVGAVEKCWRWCRRNPLVTSLTASVALLLFAVTAAMILAAASAQERAAESAARERDQQCESLMQEIQLLRLGTHSAGWSHTSWNRVFDAAGIRRDSRLQSQAAATLAGVDGRLKWHFKDQPASSVAFDAKGERLLLGGTSDPQGRSLEGGKLWTSATGELVHSEQAGSGPVAFARDGTPLQLVAREGVSLLLWDVASQKAVSECKFDPKEAGLLGALPWKELALALSAEGALVAASAPVTEQKGILAVWDGASGKRLFQHAVGARALALSPDRAFLATGDEDGRVTLWSVPEGKQVATIEATRMAVHCLAFSPDTRWLAVGGGGGTLTIWDWRRKHLISECRGSLWDVFAVTFSPDGVTLASTGRHLTKLWDVATGRLLLNLVEQSPDYITGLTFSPDGRRLVVSGKTGPLSGAVLVWELDHGRGIQTLRGLNSRVAKLCFSPDGKRVAALSHDWQVAIWELGSGHLKLLLDVPRGFTADNAALAFSPDGRRFAFSTFTDAQLWDLDSAKEVHRWKLPPGLQDTLAFHPSGKLLLFRFETRGMERTPLSDAHPRDHPRVCRVRDLLGPKPTQPIAKDIASFNWHVHGIVAPADGSYFVVDGERGTVDRRTRFIAVFDGISGKELWRVSFRDRYGTGQPRLDPTGTVLAFLQDGGSQALVEMPSGKLLDSLPGAGCLSPRARNFLFHRAPDSGEPISFSLFRRGDTAPLGSFLISDQGAESPLFNFDGGLLAWGNPDGSVSLYDLQQVRERLSKADLGW